MPLPTLSRLAAPALTAALLLAVSPLAHAQTKPSTQPSTRPATQPADAAEGKTHDGPAFSFKDPKGVNAIGFFVDSELEPILGIGGGVGGTIHYDPANPESFAGEITLSAKGLVVNNDSMTQVMHGAEWLGVEDHPLVTFTFDSAHMTSKNDNAVVLHAHGKLTLAGVTKPMEVTIAATHLEDAAKERGAAQEGDLLVLRSNFVVNREDFGIKEGMPDKKVGKEVMIVVAIVGYEQ